MQYWRMLFDIVRFNRDAEIVVGQMDAGSTLGELIARMGLSDYFTHRYLLPMAGAIWSTEQSQMSTYPAKSFIAFFRNHGLLIPQSLNPWKINQGRVQWYTIKGGASQYVQKIVRDVGDHFYTQRGIQEVQKDGEKVRVTDDAGAHMMYDAVVFACHPDHAKKILSKNLTKQRDMLTPFRYSKHNVMMHKDTACMMKKEEVWPSWTYRETSEGAVELSYNMNKLQHIKKAYPTFVTLDPTITMNGEDVFYKTQYEHPLFTIETERGQKIVESAQGEENLYFCGAWVSRRWPCERDACCAETRCSDSVGIYIKND